jgi:hypothetical protein
MAYNGYQVDKTLVLSLAPPVHQNIFAEHITVQYGISDDTPLPFAPKKVVIIGYAFNDKAQAFVVEIDGNVERPDGKPYHITLSTAERVKPFYSNILLENGWDDIEPINLDVTPFMVHW